jgi:hypothetical protein
MQTDKGEANRQFLELSFVNAPKVTSCYYVSNQYCATNLCGHFMNSPGQSLHYRQVVLYVSGGVTPMFFILGARWLRMVSFKFGHFLP